MQALSMAIGKAGIDFFAQQFIGDKAAGILSGLTPAGKTMPIKEFTKRSPYSWNTYSKITITLSNGTMVDFHPQYQSIEQLNAGTPPGSTFSLVINAAKFSASYDWNEKYKDWWCVQSGKHVSCNTTHNDKNYGYAPSFGLLAVTLTLQFSYQSQGNDYIIKVTGTSSKTSGEKANIPGKSILQGETMHGCFKHNVSKETANAVSDIKLGTTIETLFNSLTTTIAASGKLTSDITFDFALGDSGLKFPNSNGITIGITGDVTYQTTKYPGTPPANFPVPPVPTATDQHHLNIYVSNYEVDALNWAFWKDGKLDVTVDPNDLPNPAALKVKTYASWLPSLKPYEDTYMQAQVSPKAAPLTSFQDAYIFTDAVLKILKGQLPATVYTTLANTVGNEAFVSKAALEAELTGAKVSETYFATIEKAALLAGMAVTQDMQFTLVIETKTTPNPNIVFDVSRTDVMINLALGISGKVQTLQFGILNVENAVTFVSTTVPNFNKQTFGSLVWPVVGESAYMAAMEGLGKVGVPLPIMKGFTFVFDQAELSIQKGFISILTDVEFKS